MIKKPMGELLYNLLPQIYLKEDAEKTQLKRFLQVNGTGLDFIKDKTIGHSNLFDMDKVPAELLPHVAKMMGFIYPYDMSIEEQRNMLKMLPTLYKMKGTESSFNYLAQRIFGQETKAFPQWVSRGGVNGENQIKIAVETDGELSQLQTKIDRYTRYSEQFRPVNHQVIVSVLLYYADEYLRQSKVAEEYAIERLTMNDSVSAPEIYSRQTKATISYFSDILRDSNVEVYNKSAVNDEEVTPIIIRNTEIETYSKAKLNDAHTDQVIDLTSTLNVGLLNSTMVLSVTPPITTYQGG